MEKALVAWSRTSESGFSEAKRLGTLLLSGGILSGCYITKQALLLLLLS